MGMYEGMDDIATAYVRRATSSIEGVDVQAIKELARYLEDVRRQGGTVHVLGNGGSKANAGHLVLHLRDVGLMANDVLEHLDWLTAESNDHDYDQAAARYLSRMGKKEDCLVVITGSGMSANVVLALVRAKRMGMRTAGILGFDGGDAMSLCGAYIHVPSHEYGPVEDTHSVIIHTLQALLTNR